MCLCVCLHVCVCSVYMPGEDIEIWAGNIGSYEHRSSERTNMLLAAEPAFHYHPSLLLPPLFLFNVSFRFSLNYGSTYIFICLVG